MENLFKAVETAALSNSSMYGYGSNSLIEFDLSSDREVLLETARQDDPEKKWLLYMTRENGTWMFCEAFVWMKGTAQHNAWVFYEDMPSEHPRGYLIHVEAEIGGEVFGEIAPVDYLRHVEDVKRHAVIAEYEVQYTGGIKYVDASHPYLYSLEFGEFISRSDPRAKAEEEMRLDAILSKERGVMKKYAAKRAAC